ncbi:substrate-binding domain-containing protein [Hathewaya limosa]|uniref:Ribose transport system substrate-binding protein n=1 Tax=Hathewaya limosa TaxID=1536 RepID=A0ABU0JQM1_HATLI|nr:substrate-binding domain-containing protein [Hathewaya limosa]MDQ0478344.1 ribose transport system substrate-binding protein [Hathewaya limosa]
MKGFKIFFVGVVIIISAITIFFTFKNSPHNIDKNVSEDKKRIMLLAHIKTNPYWINIKSGAEEAARDRNCFLEYNGAEGNYIVENIRLMNKGIASKQDGILTYVLQEEKMKKSIEKAKDKGIAVMTIDSDVKDSSRQAYIGINNYNAGRLAAKTLIDKLKGEGEIAIIMGGKNNINQIERVKGVKDYVKQYEKIELLSIESSNSYLLESELVTKKILKEYPYVKAIICTSALDSIGAARAISDIKLKGKVQIIGFDAFDETLEYINQGLIYATIAPDAYELGYKAVNTMMDFLEGKQVKNFISPVEVITKKNIKKYKNKHKKLSELK